MPTGVLVQQIGLHAECLMQYQDQQVLRASRGKDVGCQKHGTSCLTKDA